MYCWNKISGRRASLSFGNPLVHLETNLSYVQSSWIWDASSSLQQSDQQYWSQSVGLVSSRAVILLTKSRRFGLGTSCSYGSNILLRGPWSDRVCWSSYCVFPCHVERRWWSLCPCSVPCLWCGYQPEKLICKCRVMWVSFGANISHSD